MKNNSLQVGEALTKKVAQIRRVVAPALARLAEMRRRLATAWPVAGVAEASIAVERVRSGLDGRRPVSSLRTVFDWHRPLVGFAGLMVAWGALAAVGMVVDPRTLDNALIWTKPVKFAISLGLYSLTLAWLLQMVSRPALHRIGWWAGTFGVVASLVEMSTITVQCIRGTGSHFNVSTALNSRLYLVMAVALPAFYGVILVIGTLLTAFDQLPQDRSLASALRAGLGIGVAGLTVGFAMGRPTPAQAAEKNPRTLGSHSVGGDDPSGGIPFLGWNTVHGDLRVAHFIGMHALQALPLFALGLKAAARGRLTEGTRLRIVLAVAATWAAATGTTLWQALRGQSILHPDALTGAAVATIGTLAGTAAWSIGRYAQQHPTSDMGVAVA